MSKSNKTPKSESMSTAADGTSAADASADAIRQMVTDANLAERERQLLERAELAEAHALSTEERFEAQLAQARTRIAELELVTARKRMFDETTIERIRDVGRVFEWSENQTVLAALDAFTDSDGKALREAARRLRASTLPESEVVADAIRLLVEHHDPQPIEG